MHWILFVPCAIGVCDRHVPPPILPLARPLLATRRVAAPAARSAGGRVARSSVFRWAVGGAAVGGVMCVTDETVDCAAAVIGMAGTGAVIRGVIALGHRAVR